MESEPVTTNVAAEATPENDETAMKDAEKDARKAEKAAVKELGAAAKKGSQD